MPQEKKRSGVVRELVSERHDSDTKRKLHVAGSAADVGWVKGLQPFRTDPVNLEWSQWVIREME